MGGNDKTREQGEETSKIKIQNSKKLQTSTLKDAREFSALAGCQFVLANSIRIQAPPLDTKRA
jgi:hypothetical protein